MCVVSGVAACDSTALPPPRIVVPVDLALPAPPVVAAPPSASAELTPRRQSGKDLLTIRVPDPMQNLLGVPIDEAFLTGARAPLSLSSEGPPIATLVPNDVDRRVSVLVRDKKRAKIAWEVGDVVVFGWLDAQKLRPRARTEDVFGSGGLGLAGDGARSRVRTLVCDTEVPLRAEVGEVSEVVGVIAPGTRIEVAKERDRAFEVEVPSTALRRDRAASLLVERDLALRCKDL